MAKYFLYLNKDQLVGSYHTVIEAGGFIRLGNVTELDTTDDAERFWLIENNPINSEELLFIELKGLWRMELDLDIEKLVTGMIYDVGYRQYLYK